MYSRRVDSMAVGTEAEYPKAIQPFRGKVPKLPARSFEPGTAKSFREL